MNHVLGTAVKLYGALIDYELLVMERHGWKKIEIKRKRKRKRKITAENKQ